MKDPTTRFTEAEKDMIDFSKLDESDPTQHKGKLMVGFGMYLGFRGNQEHTYLEFSQLDHGHFPPDHPVYPNYEWWGLNAFHTDKVMKLNLGTDYAREITPSMGRFPVLSDGKFGDVRRDFGGAIKRWVEKFPEEKRTGRIYRRVNKNGICFGQFDGKSTITGTIRKAFRVFGIQRWKVIRPHALRSLFNTKMSNDPNISEKEKLAACRHKSMSANVIYQDLGMQSEGHRLNCLLGAPSVPALPAPTVMPTTTTVMPPPPPAQLPAMPVPYLPAPAATPAPMPTPSSPDEPTKLPPPPTPEPTKMPASSQPISTPLELTLYQPDLPQSSTSSTSYCTSVAQVKTEASAEPSPPSSARNCQYSAATQLEFDELRSDMARLDEARKRGDELRRMSERQAEMARMRSKLKYMESVVNEQNRRLEDTQRDFALRRDYDLRRYNDELARRNSSPYSNDSNELRALYYDELHDKEDERKRRQSYEQMENYRRMMRKSRKMKPARKSW